MLGHRIAEAAPPYVKGVCVLDRSPGMLREAAIKGERVPCRAGAEALPFAASTFAKIVNKSMRFTTFRTGLRVVARELLRVLFALRFPGCRGTRYPPTFGQTSVALGETIALMRSRFLNPRPWCSFLCPDDASVVEQAPNFWVGLRNRD